MDLFVNEGNLYDRKGNEIVPDEKGIICVSLGEKPRRFVKEKLVNYLVQTGRAIQPPKIKVKRTIKRQWVRGKYDRLGKPRGKYNYRKPYVRTVQPPRTGNKIFIEKDGVEKPFISISACAKAIGVSKSMLSKIKNGKQDNFTGYKFSFSK